MNVVDSSAWISYFTDDMNADVFAAAIENLEQLLVPSITLTEVFKYMCRHADEGIALQSIAHMSQGQTVPLDSALALDAAVFAADEEPAADDPRWQPLLPEAKLEMDKQHEFSTELVPLGAVSHVRMSIFPDGGISRLRLFGQASED